MLGLRYATLSILAKAHQGTYAAKTLEINSGLNVERKRLQSLTYVATLLQREITVQSHVSANISQFSGYSQEPVVLVIYFMGLSST